MQLQNAANKKILITGATGFIGKYIVEQAIKNDFEVYLTLRKTSNTNSLEHLKFHKIFVDFSSEKTINNSFSDEIIFDVVVHNAGVKACFDETDYFKFNVELTKNLCRVLSKRNLLKGQFIYISSLAALGPGNSKKVENITEKKNENPISGYGKSKLFAEKEVVKSGLKYVILRPTAVYGKGTSDYKDLVSVAKKGMAIYTANPKQSLSFVHAEDVAKIIFLAVKNNQENQIFNVSDGNEYTLKSIYEIVAKSLNIKLKVRIQIPLFLVFTFAQINHYLERFFKIENALNSLEKANEVTALNWKCTAEKLKKELNFTTTHSLEELID